jgi:hypothetical protein
VCVFYCDLNPYFAVCNDLTNRSDYRENVKLDRYDEDQVDDRDFSELSIADRNAINDMLNRRDRERLRNAGRLPDAFLGGLYCCFP